MNTRSNLVSRAVLVALGVVGATGVALAAPPVWAHGHDHYDRDYRDIEYGRVIEVEPIMRRVLVSNPQRECWNEERPVYPGPSHTDIRSTLIGGLIGAAVGQHINLVQHGRDPGAIVGASLIGAAIGNNIGVHKAERRGEIREVDYQPTQRCEVSYRNEWQDQVDGYRVTYVYHGREYTTKMPYDPGQRIRVNVDVVPRYGDDN